MLTRTGAIVLREEEKTELALKINRAGLTTEQVSPAFIQGSKVALAGAICVFSAGLSILSPSYLFLLIFAPLGYLLPNIWLNSKIRKRQEEIENKLDQFSLYLSTALISMSNMTDALIQSAYAVGGVYKEEFEQVLREYQAGRNLTDVLIDTAYRVDVESFSSLISLLIKIYDKGVEAAEKMQQFANDMQEKKKFLIMEKAGKASIKLIFISMIFALIPLLAVIGYPAFYNIIQAI